MWMRGTQTKSSRMNKLASDNTVVGLGPTDTVVFLSGINLDYRKQCKVEYWIGCYCMQCNTHRLDKMVANYCPTCKWDLGKDSKDPEPSQPLMIVQPLVKFLIWREQKGDSMRWDTMRQWILHKGDQVTADRVKFTEQLSVVYRKPWRKPWAETQRKIECWQSVFNAETGKAWTKRLCYVVHLKRVRGGQQQNVSFPTVRIFKENVIIVGVDDRRV